MKWYSGKKIYLRRINNLISVFGFNLKSYGLIRIYAFLTERYLSYWFAKYSKTLLWPVIFYDINKTIK